MNNTNPRAIHETVLKDIIDIWDSIQAIRNDSSKLNPNKTKHPMSSSSIAKASSNLNLVFPVICSRGISIENASMVSKAVEKNAVTMLQRLFASWQIADEKNGIQSVEDYIRQFHTNLSSKTMGLDDLFDLAGRIDGVNENVLNTHSSLIKRDLSNIDYYLPTAINESSLMRYAVKEGAAVENDVGKDNDNNNSNKSGRSTIASNNKEVADSRKLMTDVFSKQVADGDFKKANELMPTTMIINFKVKTDANKDPYDFKNAVIGVKAKLYPIGSEDIVKHISEKNSDRNWITNFFRATTREISFMKDFVLAIDKAKIDAMSLSTRKSTSDKMWKVLERRATTARIMKALRQNNSAAAITTLCVSQEEVEYLRKNYNVDLERIPTVLGLFDSLNLMAICIVDESLEVAKFIYDEQEPMWETISFTHLERESSDSTYKRVVNLMTKVSR